MPLIAVLFTIAAFFWSGCAGSTAPQPVSKDLSAVALKSALASDNPPLLVDVRTPQEFADGHIAGALNIPVSEIEQHADEMPKDRRLVVY